MFFWNRNKETAFGVGMNLDYLAAWITSFTLLRFYFHGKALNPERFPRTGPVIIAANHESYLDPFLIGAGLPRALNYLCRESMFRFPIVGFYLRSVNCIPVDRDGGGAKGLMAIRDRLVGGDAVILFPEGTRTPDGNIQRAHAGIGLLIIKSTAPVMPVRVFGMYRAYNRHMLFPRPWHAMIKYGRPMLFERQREEAKTCSKARLKVIYQEVSDELMDTIARLEPCEDVNSFGGILNARPL
jgi:1-acyl-sn-glycerol-3-phosphate acyltransferase